MPLIPKDICFQTSLLTEFLFLSTLYLMNPLFLLLIQILLLLHLPPHHNPTLGFNSLFLSSLYYSFYTWSNSIILSVTSSVLFDCYALLSVHFLVPSTNFIPPSSLNSISTSSPHLVPSSPYHAPPPLPTHLLQTCFSVGHFKKKCFHSSTIDNLTTEPPYYAIASKISVSSDNGG